MKKRKYTIKVSPKDVAFTPLTKKEELAMRGPKPVISPPSTKIGTKQLTKHESSSTKGDEVSEGNITIDDSTKKVLELVKQGKSFFITGKAGTGKTTLLKKIVRLNCMRKEIAILAPTGIAAQNAGGVTMHSFLRIPLVPYIPKVHNRDLYSLTMEEAKIVRKVELIIIDEISMVRCDVLDAADDILKHYRNSKEPFGGVQVIMFGDLYQLMPVAPEEDWEKLKKYYKSPYFFDSKVMKGMHYGMLELTKVYRQADSNFVDLLNRVRVGEPTYADIKALQLCYHPDFVPDVSERHIRLSTHRRRANAYNTHELEKLKGEIVEHVAYIEGYFPKEEYPTDYVLRLKKGARVMFVKNDKEKKYVNGTLGRVVDIYKGYIQVRTDEGHLVNVERQTWDFTKYRIDKETNKMFTYVIGSFKQYPLKLAWAITIHKSQGLTFDAVIIDAAKAFTPGQVYVALSRCRFFNTIVLVTPITRKQIMIDPIVTDYMNRVHRIGGKDTPLPSVPQKTDDIDMSTPLGQTLWMARDGLTLVQMLERTNRSMESLLMDIAKLVGLGKVDVHQYINEKKYDDVMKAIRMASPSIHLKVIKSHCQSDVMMGEINIVLYALRYQGVLPPT